MGVRALVLWGQQKEGDDEATTDNFETSPSDKPSFNAKQAVSC